MAHIGEDDPIVIDLNVAAYADLRCEKQLVIVPRATHLFEEPGALEEVAILARKWFERHLIENIGNLETKGGRELWPSS